MLWIRPESPRVLDFAAFAVALVFAVSASLSAHAQSFSVIHSFSGGGDGYQPFSHITIDRAGNLYGTTSEYTGPGTVFEMKKSQSGWVLHTLLTFDNFNGGVPQGGVTFAPDGTLYGTTSEYGNGESAAAMRAAAWSLTSGRDGRFSKYAMPLGPDGAPQLHRR